MKNVTALFEKMSEGIALAVEIDFATSPATDEVYRFSIINSGIRRPYEAFLKARP